MWGWCSKRPGDRGQCRGTTTEHRSSPGAPHLPKLARNSGTRTLCSTPKRCNSNGAISMFEIRLGELRATFLRNHNMRCHNDPTKCPKQKTTQADNSSTEDPRNPDNRHKHGGTAPVTWRCTRYVAVHPLRGGAPEQKRCIAYGSGAVPQQTRTNAELAHRTTHRHTPPCAPGPYWRQDGHTAHAATCTPAHSDPLRPTPTPPTPLHAKSPLTCAQVGPERHLTGRRRDLWERTRPPMPQHLELPPPTCSV